MNRQHCCRCDAIPEDILVLECRHGLCIGCSSVLLTQHQNTIQCFICHQRTQLQIELIHELNQQSRQSTHYKKDAKRNSIKHSKESATKYSNFNSIADHYPKSIASSHYNSPSFPPLKASRDNYKDSHFQSNCKVHGEYELMYTCHDCNQAFICPECVIHGTHYNHNVQSIKNYVIEVHSQLSKQIQNIDCQIEGLIKAGELKRSELLNKSKQIHKLKISAAEKYEKIRRELEKEEKQIIAKCEELLECYNQEYKSIEEWIRNDIQVVSARKDEMNRILYPEKLDSENSRALELRVVSEFVKYKKQNCKAEYCWIGQGHKMREDRFHESMEVLTDRIEKIDFNKLHPQQQKIVESPVNWITHQNKICSSSLYFSQSRFKEEKQNIPLKHPEHIRSQARQSRKRKPQQNFLVF